MADDLWVREVADVGGGIWTVGYWDVGDDTGAEWCPEEDHRSREDAESAMRWLDEHQPVDRG